MVSSTRGTHEDHVKSLLKAANMIHYYEDVVKIISTYMSKSSINVTLTAGKYVYRFDIEKQVSANVVSRVFKGKYDINLKNSVQFIPIYSPDLDRVVTLKYWGEYKDSYNDLKNLVIEFRENLDCKPSGICEYSRPLSTRNCEELRRSMGLYWTFSLSLPYKYRNPLLGNIYVIVDDDELILSKIFHTLAFGKNHKFSILYNDLSATASHCRIDSNYLTYFVIYTLKIRKNGKIEKDLECVPYLRGKESNDHFSESDFLFRIAFFILRSMYLRRKVEETYPDILYIGSISEFKSLFMKVFNMLKSELSGFNINVKINFDQMIHKIFNDEELKFGSKGQEIEMFVRDKEDNIIFVHPYLTTLFLTDKNRADIIKDVVTEFKDPLTRKELLRTILDLLRRNGTTTGIFDVSDKLKRLVPSLDSNSDIPFLVQTFKKVYESVVLNKIDATEQN